MYFRRRLLQPEAPGFRGDPKRHLGKGAGDFSFGDVCFWEVPFHEDLSENKIQNHSHEIRLEKLVCMLFTRYNFAVTPYQNMPKPLKKTIFCPICLGHRPEFTRIPMNSYVFEWEPLMSF